MRMPTLLGPLTRLLFWGGLALGATLVGCGARTPAPVDSEECYGGSCDPPPIATPEAVELQDEDLQLIFPPDVRREEALKVVMRCQRRDPGGNPRMAGLECPVDIGKVKIDVQEGPAATSLMLRIGDARQAEALQSWFEETLPGGRPDRQ